jgi:hypothetical protein
MLRRSIIQRRMLKRAFASRVRKERLDQSRKDASQRKRISRFREALRQLLPLEGEPICDGRAQFHVASLIAERAARTEVSRTPSPRLRRAPAS